MAFEANIVEYGARDNGELCTAAIQRALDACREAGGGTVVVPPGRFALAGVRMYSHTTLLLQRGAQLWGSDRCGDYPIFPLPPGLEPRDDTVFIAYNFPQIPPGYRRALISAYGAEDIAIIGEGDNVIDGADCFDPQGEEGLRGPHGIYLSCCNNVRLAGYTIQNTGNFMHQLDNCQDVTLSHVTALGGHDGIHLTECRRMLIEHCTFHSGDDCIAGCNVQDITVAHCDLNTSCQCFRIGGGDLRVRHCHLWGPGIYPHRMTVVKGPHEVLPREMGRHNTLYAFIFFASDTFPAPQLSGRWEIEDCVIENIDCLLCYQAGRKELLQAGAYLREVTFRNTAIAGIKAPAEVEGCAEAPLTITFAHCPGADGELIRTNDYAEVRTVAE